MEMNVKFRKCQGYVKNTIISILDIAFIMALANIHVYIAEHLEGVEVTERRKVVIGATCT